MIRILRRILAAADIVMAVLLSGMIALVFANVVLRYGFSSGIRQSVELARLMFVWVVMLGAVSLLHRGEHLGMPEFAERYLPGWLPWIARFNWLVILGTSVMLVWGSVRVSVANWDNISQLTGLTQSLFYLPGVLCGGMMVVIALGRLVRPTPVTRRDAMGDIA